MRISEWASCIEANVEQISLMVTEELVVGKVNFTQGQDQLILHLNAKLHGLPYCWWFYLDRASDDEFLMNWSLPVLVQLKELDAKVEQLTATLEYKQRQLEELLPDNKNKKKSPQKSVDTIGPSASSVVNDGISSIFEKHLSCNYQAIHEAITKAKKISELSQDAPLAALSTEEAENNVEKEEEERTVITAQEADRDKEEEEKRREKIQKIIRGEALEPSQTQRKKKKKLNI
ncbi:uncharacterized protein LOC143023019 isoform X2 [Oratosquilla oratoria]|uniref:uncharacterized protein LOC143023019 isoform X2 n=1 Tax=Oratosquilla oratoria TaxID=337810 RepID=UPI003F7638FA